MAAPNSDVSYDLAPRNKSFFSFQGIIHDCWDNEKQLKIKVDQRNFDRIVDECSMLSNACHQSNQPYLPAWSTQDGSHYVKLLLSKAKKAQYEDLKSLQGLQQFNVTAMPFEIKNAQTGHVDGISLYFYQATQRPQRAQVRKPKAEETKN